MADTGSSSKALETKFQQNNVSDYVIFNCTRWHNSARRAHCSYGKGPFWTCEKGNMMSRDLWKYSGYRGKALTVGRTKVKGHRRDQKFKAFSVAYKRNGQYFKPRTQYTKKVVTARWGPKWRKWRKAIEGVDMKDGEIIKEYGYKGGNLPRRELPHKKDQEGKWVLHGPMRNYQREWVKRSVKNLTSNQLYRSDLASTVQRRIFKHLELDAQKRKERRLAAKYYELWAGTEDDDQPSKGGKAVNNEDLVEVD